MEKEGHSRGTVRGVWRYDLINDPFLLVLQTSAGSVVSQ